MSETSREPSPLRALTAMLGLSWRVAPVNTFLVLTIEPIAAILTIVFAIANGWLVQAILLGNPAQTTAAAWVVGASFGVSQVFLGIGRPLRQSLREKVTHQVDVEVSALAAGLVTIEHLERPEYLDKIELLRNDSIGLGEVVQAIEWVVQRLATLAVAFAVLVTIHPVLLLMPAAGLLGLVLSIRGNARRERLERHLAPIQRLGKHLLDVGTDPTAAKELRVYELRTEVARRHQLLWRERQTLTLRANRRDHLESVLLNGGVSGVWLAAVAFVTHRALQGNTPIGDVVAVLLIGGMVTRMLPETLAYLQYLSTSLRSATRFVWLRDYASSRRVSQTPLLDPPRQLRAGIKFQDVSFTYPGAERPALCDLSFELPAGAVAALVGDNGAGKTTLVKLLTRMYDPDEGIISVDGLALNSLDPAAWRSRVRAAFQDHLRLAFIARHVIGAGELASRDDDAAVTAAVARAGAVKVIDRLPQALETQLGSQLGGVELSGGQWQQLALSRGLMRIHALLTVFDEPTAALDAHAEANLFERFVVNAKLETDIAGVTLLVSHRFSTVRHADLILVLNDGKIQEQGTHEELMLRDGLYAELFQLHADGYS